jgi:hypothetical protein
MKNLIQWTALVVGCATLCSCGLFSNEQVLAALTVINQLAEAGTITAEQAEAMRQALQLDSGEPWYMQLGRVVLEVGLAVAGVRMWRGPAATAAERVARAAG